MNQPNRMRPNVGIMIINREEKILAGEAFYYPDDWMMPQGGIDPGESPYDAMRRELREETGLAFTETEFLKEHTDWFEYLFPKPQFKDDIYYVGQKQKWFLLRYEGDPPDPTRASEREFQSFGWVEPDWLMKHTREFRRPLYQDVFAALLPQR